MRKKMIVLALAVVLLCCFRQFVFADAVDPGFDRSGGGTIAVVLIIAVLLVAVILIIRRLRRRR